MNKITGTSRGSKIEQEIEQESTSAKLPTLSSKTEAGLSPEEAGIIVTRAGGIFLGENLLRKLSYINEDTVVPPLPEKLSEEFLGKSHPLCGGTIAENIILGFDLQTGAWYCFDKSVVPNSMGSGKYEGGLTLAQQLELLKLEGASITVCGVKYKSPTNYRPILNLLKLNQELHQMSGKDTKDLPLYRTWGRTNDQSDRDRACLSVGFHASRGYIIGYGGPESVTGTATGLLAEWKVQ